MQLSHTRAAMSAVSDDPNLVSAAGLVPVLALADSAGLRGLADERLSLPGDKGANAGLKVASLVAGMVAGADSIDDMALLRHGGMGRVFERAYAPSTLGSFLRAFTFGHVRQVDAVASRVLTALGSLTLPSGKFTANAAWLVLAVIAFNLTQAAATLTGSPPLAKATTATIRRTLIAIPARVASSARRITLHLPAAWPGRPRGPTCSPTAAVHPSPPPPDHPADTRRDRSPDVEHADSEVSHSLTPPVCPSAPKITGNHRSPIEA